MGLSRYIYVYIQYVDDILIVSDSIEEPLEHLNIFSILCLKHGIGLPKMKVKIGLKEIEFLDLK